MGREEESRYARVMVSSEGHIKPDPTPTHYRTGTDGVYLAAVRDGRWREQKLLAFPPDAQETDYCPGVGEVKEVFRQRLRNRTSENLKALVSTRARGGR
jgi:hypothetical protein